MQVASSILIELRFAMTWLASLTAAIISGLASVFLAGVIANACVSWYSISSREGASGFYVIFNALLGGIAGFALGLFAARMVAANYGPGFAKELLAALGLVLLVSGTTAVLCRLFADVPPTIDDCELTLEVEFRFPNTLDTDKPPTAEGQWDFVFASLSGQTRRRYENGVIKTDAARLEIGRWIVPAHAHLFTERGGRSVTLAEHDATSVMGFSLPLPRRPDSTHESWSPWIPHQQGDGKPWPADKMSCRFRVQKILPSNLSP